MMLLDTTPSFSIILKSIGTEILPESVFLVRWFVFLHLNKHTHDASKPWMPPLAQHACDTVAYAASMQRTSCSRGVGRMCPTRWHGTLNLIIRSGVESDLHWKQQAFSKAVSLRPSLRTVIHVCDLPGSKYNTTRPFNTSYVKSLVSKAPHLRTVVSGEFTWTVSTQRPY